MTYLVKQWTAYNSYHLKKMDIKKWLLVITLHRSFNPKKTGGRGDHGPPWLVLRKDLTARFHDSLLWSIEHVLKPKSRTSGIPLQSTVIKTYMRAKFGTSCTINGWDPRGGGGGHHTPPLHPSLSSLQNRPVFLGLSRDTSHLHFE